MENQNPNKKLNIGKLVIIAFVAVGLGVISLLTYQSRPELFQASLTGGSTADTTVDKHLYIPTDYKAEAGDHGSIAVKAGKTLTKLNGLKVSIWAATSQITLSDSIITTGTALSGVTPVSSTTICNQTSGKCTIDFGTLTSTIASVSDDTVLFYMPVVISSSLSSGATIPISIDTTNSSITLDTTTSTPTASDGLITITSTDACSTLNCGSYGYCDDSTTPVACICDTGYAGTRCTVCDTGYSGYPTCLKDAFANLEGMVLTLSTDTISKLTSADKLKAYSSVYLMLNSTSAAGQTISIEGSNVTIPTASTGTTDAEKIDSMIDGLKTLLEAVTGVNVTKYSNVTGLIKIEATTGNTDNSLDGISSTSGEVIIVPGMNYTITLHPTDSYKLRILGKSSDGTMIEMNYDDVKWMPQPVNRLSSTSLAGGLLEKGTESGTTPLYVQVSLSGGLTLNSVNQLSVNVPSEPIIEYIHRVGSTAIERGGRINLSVKVSDFEEISDIKTITTSIVKPSSTSYSTYTEIKNDTGAVWFTATNYPSEVITTSTSTTTTTSSTTSSTTGDYYKIYTIPVEIPQDTNLVDGDYKLVLEITDTAGHTTASVLSITIGAAASGDIDGDGNITMLDVIVAYQISFGAIIPTQTQLKAGDLDNDGKISMLDVITLYNQIN